MSSIYMVLAIVGVVILVTFDVTMVQDCYVDSGFTIELIMYVLVFVFIVSLGVYTISYSASLVSSAELEGVATSEVASDGEATGALDIEEVGGSIEPEIGTEEIVYEEGKVIVFY